MPDRGGQTTRGGGEVLAALAWYLAEIDRLAALAIDRLVANPAEARMYLTIIREHGPKLRALCDDRLRPLLLRREQAQRTDDAMATIADRLSAIEARLRAPADPPASPIIIPLRRDSQG